MRGNAVELAITGWSACAPGLDDSSSWHAWANGDKNIYGPINTEVRFVERLLRRRLSPLNRMAFKVMAECMDGENSRPLIVFSSRYGEFSRAFEMLKNLARDESISPKTFSLSVHNTASSLYQIMQQDNSHSTALSAGEASLEVGFLECWTLLKEAAATSTLLIYCDQTLPKMFSGQVTNVHDTAAFALLLRLPREDSESSELSLSWHAPTERNSKAEETPDRSALRVLKLLLKGGDQISSDFGRLTWIWKYSGSPA